MAWMISMETHHTFKNDHVGFCCLSVFPSLEWDCVWLDASWWLGTEVLSEHHVCVWSSCPAWWMMWPHTVLILRVRCLFLEGALRGIDQNHQQSVFNPLKPELNPICYLLALLGAHHFLHISRIRVKLLTFRLLMSYIYGAPILDVSRSHTTTQHSR